MQIEEGDQETVEVKLPNIMFELKVRLQKMLSIKVEEELEILVGSSMRGDRKLDERWNWLNYWQVQMYVTDVYYKCILRCIL